MANFTERFWVTHASPMATRYLLQVVVGLVDRVHAGPGKIAAGVRAQQRDRSETGRSPFETIAREIEVETGFRAGRIEPLLSFEPMVGMVDGPHHLFLARDLERVGEPTEVTESARLQWVPLGTVPELIAKGEIWNSGTLIALMQVLLSRQQG